MRSTRGTVLRYTRATRLPSTAGGSGSWEHSRSTAAASPGCARPWGSTRCRGNCFRTRPRSDCPGPRPRTIRSGAGPRPLGLDDELVVQAEVGRGEASRPFGHGLLERGVDHTGQRYVAVLDDHVDRGIGLDPVPRQDRIAVDGARHAKPYLVVHGRQGKNLEVVFDRLHAGHLRHQSPDVTLAPRLSHLPFEPEPAIAGLHLYVVEDGVIGIHPDLARRFSEEPGFVRICNDAQVVRHPGDPVYLRNDPLHLLLLRDRLDD